MSTPTYPAYYTAAGQPSFTQETPVGDFILSYPFGEADPTALIITQRFWQLRANYQRPSPNALNNSAYSSARFIDDSTFRDVGMGITEWTRTWAIVPASRYEYESYAFTFPGFDVIGASREPFTRAVTSRVTYDYFLLGAGGYYSSPDEIPLLSLWSFTASYLTDDTSPSYTTYQGYIGSSYAINLESNLRRWQGNIYERANREINAL